MRLCWYRKVVHLADRSDCSHHLSFHSDAIFAEATGVGASRPFDIYLTPKCLLSCSLLCPRLCPHAVNVTSYKTLMDTAPTFICNNTHLLSTQILNWTTSENDIYSIQIVYADFTFCFIHHALTTTSLRMHTLIHLGNKESFGIFQ